MPGFPPRVQLSPHVWKRTGGTYDYGAEIMTDETKTTPGVTYFFQGEGQTHPLFRIAEGIPCRSAREQASELMGYARDLSLTGLMDGDQQMMWASHYFAAMAKALLDDAELGLMR